MTVARLLPPEYYQCLHELQAVDFVLDELMLYLDTHPDDAQAQEQFELFARGRMNLASQFETRFGPLQSFGNSPGGAGAAWVDGPWPWQV